MIHGWGLGRAAWQPIVTAVSACCNVHHVDLPGYGDAAPDPCSFEDTARRIVDSLPAGTILCGWSLGALLALEMASQRPERIGGLVLVGASPSSSSRTIGLMHNRQRYSTGSLPPSAITRPKPCNVSSPCSTKALRGRANTRAQQQALAESPTPDTDSLIQGLDWLRKTELRQKVATITIPTLLIHGESDPLMPLSARALAGRPPAAGAA